MGEWGASPRWCSVCVLAFNFNLFQVTGLVAGINMKTDRNLIYFLSAWVWILLSPFSIDYFGYGSIMSFDSHPFLIYPVDSLLWSHPQFMWQDHLSPKVPILQCLWPSWPPYPCSCVWVHSSLLLVCHIRNLSANSITGCVIFLIVYHFLVIIKISVSTQVFSSVRLSPLMLLNISMVLISDCCGNEILCYIRKFIMFKSF